MGVWVSLPPRHRASGEYNHPPQLGGPGHRSQQPQDNRAGSRLGQHPWMMASRIQQHLVSGVSSVQGPCPRGIGQAGGTSQQPRLARGTPTCQDTCLHPLQYCGFHVVGGGAKHSGACTGRAMGWERLQEPTVPLRGPPALQTTEASGREELPRATEPFQKVSKELSSVLRRADISLTRICNLNNISLKSVSLGHSLIT